MMPVPVSRDISQGGFACMYISRRDTTDPPALIVHPESNFHIEFAHAARDSPAVIVRPSRANALAGALRHGRSPH